MSSTHQNLIPSDVLSSMSQRKHMSKNPFWDFRFDRLWLFNFQFGCRPKSTNHIIMVSTHLISNMKIDLKSSRSREFKVKNTFLDFECHIFGIHCDSSSSTRARVRPVTPKKFLKCGFWFFHQILPFSFESWSMCYFGCLIYQTPHLASNNYFEFKWEKNLSYEEELVFKKNLSSKCRIYT